MNCGSPQLHQNCDYMEEICVEKKRFDWFGNEIKFGEEKKPSELEIIIDKIKKECVENDRV